MTVQRLGTKDRNAGQKLVLELERKLHKNAKAKVGLEDRGVVSYNPSPDLQILPIRPTAVHGSGGPRSKIWSRR